MATRSRIGIENQDGTVTSVYCHWDGYPENNGRICIMKNKTKTNLVFGLLFTLVGILGILGISLFVGLIL